MLWLVLPRCSLPRTGEQAAELETPAWQLDHVFTPCTVYEAAPRAAGRSDIAARQEIPT